LHFCPGYPQTDSSTCTSHVAGNAVYPSNPLPAYFLGRELPNFCRLDLETRWSPEYLGLQIWVPCPAHNWLLKVTESSLQLWLWICTVWNNSLVKAQVLYIDDSALAKVFKLKHPPLRKLLCTLEHLILRKTIPAWVGSK
jgi:hypothetical protein